MIAPRNFGRSKFNTDRVYRRVLRACPQLAASDGPGSVPLALTLRVCNRAFSLFLVGAALAAALVVPALAAQASDLPPVNDLGPSPFVPLVIARSAATKRFRHPEHHYGG
jgi:hypothetical protein